MAESREARLTLLHVHEPIPKFVVSDDQQRLVRDHARLFGENLADWITSRTDIEVELELPRGSPASVICSRSREAQLIVAGASSIDPARLGPLPRRLARKARSDVLVVRRQPRVPYRRVLAAVDMSKESNEAVELAFRLAPDAAVTVVYAVPSQYDTILSESGLFEEELEVLRRDRAKLVRERLDEYSALWNGRVGSAVVDGPPVEAIEEEALRRNADLVVVSSRGADHTSLVLLGGNAEGIMENVHCDVAVARVAGTFRRR